MTEKKKPRSPRRAKRTKRPFGTLPFDFAPTKRDRLGYPDYYHTLSPSDLEWIGKFNEEYVGASFVGRKDDKVCTDDNFSAKEKRNEINREVNSAKRDLATRISVGRTVHLASVTALSYAYADYLYVLTGDEGYLIRERTRGNPFPTDGEKDDLGSRKAE